MNELFLLARVAGRGVAIEASHVDSVVDIGEVIVVPCAEPWVRGLAALRSRVVTVVDTAVALGQPIIPSGAADRTPRAIISRVDGHYYALLMDELEDVGPFERRPLSSGVALSERWHRAATGWIEREGEPLLVVDPAGLLGAVAAEAA